MAGDNGVASGDRAGAGREKSEEDIRRSQGQSYDGDGANTDGQLRDFHREVSSLGNGRGGGYTTITWINASLGTAAKSCGRATDGLRLCNLSQMLTQRASHQYVSIDRLV